MSALPFDIINEVLELCTIATLASCTLVCQDFAELSRSRLYRSVTIASGKIAAVPDDIATTSSHLLRYVRHLEIYFSENYVTRPTRQDVIQIFHKLVTYGNLTAIWFNSQGDPWQVGFSKYSRHLVPFLQMDSVKYIRAPLVAPRASAEPEKEFVESLFLSKACLDLDTVSRHNPHLPRVDYLAIKSSNPSIHTLRLEFHPDVKAFRKYWKWLTSHVDLGCHLRRLHISIDLAQEDVHGCSGIWSELKYHLPKCLSELSISSHQKDYLIPFHSKFPIEYFHSLSYLSISFFAADVDNHIHSYLTALIQFIQRVPPSSRVTLREINLFFELFEIEQNLMSDGTMMKWKTLGEVIKNSFPSSLQTTIYTSPPDSAILQQFSEHFLSGLPTARRPLDFPHVKFSKNSDEYWRDVKFGWEGGVRNSFCV